MDAVSSATSSSRGVVSPSIGMALRVLDALAESRSDLSATEINAALNLPKSTLHRILNSLEVENAVRRHPVTRRYSVGPRVTKHASAARRSGLVASFMDIAGRFVDEHDETIQLCTLADGMVTFIAFVESTQPVRLNCQVGRQKPAHATASGKVLLAYAPPELRDDFFRAHGPLEQITSETVVSPEALHTQFEQIVERGFATESQESARNLSCIAAPVFNRNGDVVAALTLCLTSNVITDEMVDRLVAPLAEVSRGLSLTM